MSSGAMTNRVDRLEDRNLVVRQPDESDRRGVIVSLTRNGRKLIDKAILLRLDVADEGLIGITKKERSQLASLLRKVRLSSQMN